MKLAAAVLRCASFKGRNTKHGLNGAPWPWRVNTAGEKRLDNGVHELFNRGLPVGRPGATFRLG